MTDAPKETVAERFEHGPLNNPPPCLREPDKECLATCEHGIAGPCKREQRAKALDELGRMDGELL